MRPSEDEDCFSESELEMLRKNDERHGEFGYSFDAGRSPKLQYVKHSDIINGKKRAYPDLFYRTGNDGIPTTDSKQYYVFGYIYAYYIAYETKEDLVEFYESTDWKVMSINQQFPLTFLIKC